MQNIRAEVALGTHDLQGDIGFFTKTLGFRMDAIYPADDPRVAHLSGFGLKLVLDSSVSATGTVRLVCDDPVLIADGQTALTAPGGTQICIVASDPPLEIPRPVDEFVVRRLTDQAAWVVGRAGMQYRDLIPSRLGGSIIASHIRIPDGGPVPDMVHYHSVGFQLIYCYKGWVDLVYEDQGPPFRLHAGDCVIQPPEIRHRVLYASDNIEVIEIGVPAEHVTTIDHAMDLPTATLDPDRLFDGQRFVHFKAADVDWTPHRIPGLVAKETGIAANTGGVAAVQIVTVGDGPCPAVVQDAEILFGFVLDGSAVLTAHGQDDHAIAAGDAFVLPPNRAAQFKSTASDFTYLEVALPGTFKTQAT